MERLQDLYGDIATTDMLIVVITPASLTGSQVLANNATA
jgi:hypothetical protein